MKMPMLGAIWLLPFVSACTSYMETVPPMGPPGPGEAKVVFCRPSRFIAGGIEYPIWDGDQLVGFAEHGSTIEHRCAPGEHFFVAKAQSYKGISAVLTAGDTYYVWVTPRVGAWTSAVGFTPVRKEDVDLLAELHASLAKTEYRAPLGEDCGPYEQKHRDAIRDTIAKFRAGEYTPEPSLSAADGHRESPVPRP